MRVRGFAVFLIIAGAAPLPQMLAGILTVTPHAQVVPAGSTGTIDLFISGSPLKVGSFDIDLSFDPAVLLPLSATFGPFLGGTLDSISASTLGTTSINLFEVSLLSVASLNALQPASFIAATVSFTMVGDGTSPLNLTINSIGDAEGQPLGFVVENGSVSTMNSEGVPEPGTFSSTSVWLLGAAVFVWRRSVARRAPSSVASLPIV